MISHSFSVRHSSRFSIDDRDLFDIGMVQALDQDTISDNDRNYGYNCFNFHAKTFHPLAS
jgi:hypothetical protein